MAIGYWGEFSYTQEDTVRYLKTSFGIDYTFPFPVYGMVEYFYDGSGEDNPANYDFTKVISGLAQQYLYIILGSVHNPFLRPAAGSIINL